MFTLFNVQKFCFVLVGLYFTLLASARPQFSGASLAKRDAIANSSALLTNAARMQAGLAPLKPRSFYRPTRVARELPHAFAFTVKMLTRTLQPAIHPPLRCREMNSGHNLSWAVLTFVLIVAPLAKSR